jgi:hypothetical protein
VPYAPGGGTDLAARVLSGPLAAALGQKVIVENVSGGSALIGTGRVARAAPDGYTLLAHQTALAVNVSLFPKASFNVEKDLTAVGQLFVRSSGNCGIARNKRVKDRQRHGNIPRHKQNDQRKMPQKNGHGDFSQSNGVRYVYATSRAVVLLMRAKTLFAEAFELWRIR